MAITFVDVHNTTNRRNQPNTKSGPYCPTVEAMFETVVENVLLAEFVFCVIGIDVAPVGGRMTYCFLA